MGTRASGTTIYDTLAMLRLELAGREKRVAELEAENARLRVALLALVTDSKDGLPAGIADYDNYRYCLYCYKPMQKDFRDTGHAPDCPIVKGREALAKGQGDQ